MTKETLEKPNTRSVFERISNFGGTMLTLRLRNAPVFQGNDTFWFGGPIGLSESSNVGKPESRVADLGGYFLMVSYSAGECVIANDITGGYRLYSYRHDNQYYLSDDYEFLLTVMREHGQVQKSEQQFTYWQKHRYTTGSNTFVKHLNKLAPATILRITGNGIQEDSYFADLPSTPDKSKHCTVIYESLTSTIDQAVSSSREPILFFSGGVDSTLLALLLKQNGCRFRSVVCVPSPLYAEAYKDLRRARQIAEYIGLKLEELPLTLDLSPEIMDPIVHEMLFDRHFSVVHFAAMKELRRLYGTELTIINGQAADSILTYGPSQNTRGDLAARALVFAQGTPLAMAAGSMVRAKHGSRFRRPNKDESALAFFDQHEYYTMIDTHEAPEYRNYLSGLLKPIQSRFQNDEAFRMYLKTYGFLQGSDNQVVIRSSQAAGIHHVIMPYASPAIISATIRYREPWRELISPKYVIHQLLKELGYQRQPVNIPKRSEFASLNEITRDIDDIFMRKAGELFQDHKESVRI